VAHWLLYESLDPRLVLKRLQESLAPPPTVGFRLDGNRIVAEGTAPSAWLARARIAAGLLPAGAPVFDFSAVGNIDADSERRWQEYLAELAARPGIVITEAGRRDGKFQVAGLRDPLAADPMQMLGEAGINPAEVVSRWAPYEALDPELVLKRLQARLEPPAGVTLTLEGNRIVAQGSAPSAWIDRARLTARMLPAGAPGFDVSAVQNVGGEALGRLRQAIQAESIRFNYNESLPAAGQDATLDQLATQLHLLTVLSSANLVRARVLLTGHSDSVGQGTFNLSLSLARAEAVRALLKKRKVDPGLLAVRGAGALESIAEGTSDEARSVDRSVSFSVEIEEQQ
jgi:outer membrane protein OmpA-like peptidoglycan-associated protein